MVCAPALLRYLRGGGWSEIRLRVLTIAVVTVTYLLAERFRPEPGFTGGTWGNTLITRIFGAFGARRAMVARRRLS